MPPAADDPEKEPANLSVPATRRPKISVVMATYDVAPIVQGALDSVFGQTYPHLELIVIDGGSKDGTVDILRRAGDRIAFWSSEQDDGPFDAMNKGAARATGDYVLFLGADDRLRDITPVVPYLQDPRTIYYGDVWLKYGKRRFDGPYGAYKLAVKNICQQGILYPRGVFERYRHEVRYWVLADHALNLMCYADKDFRFEYIPETVAEYDDRMGQSFSNRDDDFEADRLALYRRTLPWWLFAVLWVRVVALRALERIALRGPLRRATRRVRGAI